MSKDLPAQFVVNVPEEGAFTFRKRTMRTQVEIECEYARLTEGVSIVTHFLGKLATMMSDLKALTISAPGGWDPEGLDADDENGYARLTRVWEALRETERSFRQPVEPKAPGQGDGGDSGALVPQDLSAGAD